MFQTLLWRALRLRCPMCGRGHMFGGYWKVHKECSECGVRFEREPGFFLGSIYFNYGLTALVVAIAYPVLLFSGVLSERPLLWAGLAFTIVFPMWFFRYSRSLWAGFDQYWDPREQEEGDAATTAQDSRG